MAGDSDDGWRQGLANLGLAKPGTLGGLIVNPTLPGGPEIPSREIGPGDLTGTWNAASYALGQLASSDPAQLADIVTKMVPGARRYDAKGVLAIELPAEGDQPARRFYLNRPGLSQADVMNTAAQLAAGIGASKLGASIVGKVLGPVARLGRVVTEAVTQAGASVAADVGAMALGSEQGVSPGRAAVAAAGGAIGELGATGIADGVARAWRWLKGTATGARMLDSTGAPTATFQRILQEQGVDWANASEATRQAVADALRRAGAASEAEAAELVREATRRGAGGEFEIPLTAGQRSGERAALDREEAMRRGASGDVPRQTMGNFDASQRESVNAARSNMRETMTGRPAADEAELGGVVQRGARAADEARAALEDEAWGAFRAIARDTAIRPERMDVLRDRVNAAMDEFIASPQTTARAAAARDEIAAFGRGADGAAEPVDALQLDLLRRKIGNQKPADAEDAKAVGQVRRVFNDWLVETTDDHLARGTPEALDAMRAAVASTRERRALFNPDGAAPDVRRRLESLIDRDLSGREVMNWAYGAGALSDAAGSRQMVAAINDLAGGNPEVREALRQGALIRILDGPGLDRAGYRQAKNRIDAALGPGARELTEALFNEEERAQLGRFSDVMGRLAQSRESANPSGSAFTILGALGGGAVGGGLGTTLANALAVSTLGNVGMTVAGTGMAAMLAREYAKRQAKEAAEKAAVTATTTTAGPGAEAAAAALHAMPLRQIVRAATPAAGAAAARGGAPSVGGLLLPPEPEPEPRR